MFKRTALIGMAAVVLSLTTIVPAQAEEYAVGWMKPAMKCYEQTVIVPGLSSNPVARFKVCATYEWDALGIWKPVRNGSIQVTGRVTDLGGTFGFRYEKGDLQVIRHKGNVVEGSYTYCCTGYFDWQVTGHFYTTQLAFTVDRYPWIHISASAGDGTPGPATNPYGYFWGQGGVG